MVCLSDFFSNQKATDLQLARQTVYCDIGHRKGFKENCLCNYIAYCRRLSWWIVKYALSMIIHFVNTSCIYFLITLQTYVILAVMTFFGQRFLHRLKKIRYILCKKHDLFSENEKKVSKLALWIINVCKTFLFSFIWCVYCRISYGNGNFFLMPCKKKIHNTQCAKGHGPITNLAI